MGRAWAIMNLYQVLTEKTLTKAYWMNAVFFLRCYNYVTNDKKKKGGGYEEQFLLPTYENWIIFPLQTHFIYVMKYLCEKIDNIFYIGQHHHHQSYIWKVSSSNMLTRHNLFKYSFILYSSDFYSFVSDHIFATMPTPFESILGSNNSSCLISQKLHIIFCNVCFQNNFLLFYHCLVNIIVYCSLLWFFFPQ